MRGPADSARLTDGTEFLPDCRECTLDLSLLIDEAPSEPHQISLPADLINEIDRVCRDWEWEDEDRIGRMIQIFGWLTINLVEEFGANAAGQRISSLVRSKTSVRITNRRVVVFDMDSALRKLLEELHSCWGWVGGDRSKLQAIIEYCCWNGLRIAGQLGNAFSGVAEESIRGLYHSFTDNPEEVALLVRKIRQD